VIALPRREWILWQTLAAPGTLIRRPSYGDYGIQNPTSQAAPYTGNAAIRYTDSAVFLIFRGNRLIGRFGGYGQYQALAKACVAHPSYRRAKYSAGDLFIAGVANGTAGPGNLATWRYVGMNQHITYVARTVHKIP